MNYIKYNELDNFILLEHFIFQVKYYVFNILRIQNKCT